MCGVGWVCVQVHVCGCVQVHGRIAPTCCTYITSPPPPPTKQHHHTITTTTTSANPLQSAYEDALNRGLPVLFQFLQQQASSDKEAHDALLKPQGVQVRWVCGLGGGGRGVGRGGGMYGCAFVCVCICMCVQVQATYVNTHIVHLSMYHI